MKPKTPWLFIDLDGTLVDTIPQSRKAFFDLGKSLAVKLTNDDFDNCNGPSMLEIADYIRRKHRLPHSVATINSLHEEKLNRAIANCKIRPYTKSALAQLHRQGWKCALVTSAHKRYALSVLKKHGISRFFEFIVSGDEVRQSKPHPQIYEIARKRAGNGYHVALEDSENGIEAAKNAGCTVLKFSTNTDGFFFCSSFRSLPRKLRIYDSSPLIVGFSPKFTFSLAPVSRLHLSPAKTRAVNRAWARAAARNDSLYDGRVFVLVEEKSGYSFSGRFVPFRYLHYQLNSDDYLGLIPCAVTGIVKQGNNVILMRRSHKVTSAKNLFEFAPSGTIDPSSYDKARNRINPRKQIFKELSEELGIPASQVIELRPVCLVFDVRDVTLDAVYQVFTKKNARLTINKEEHSEIVSLPPKKLNDLIAQNPDQYISLVRFVGENNILEGEAS